MGQGPGFQQPAVTIMAHACMVWARGCGRQAKRQTRTRMHAYKGVRRAGTAVGIAVAFSAPIGGLLFAFEELANSFSQALGWQIFFACMIAVRAPSLALMLPLSLGIAWGVMRCRPCPQVVFVFPCSSWAASHMRQLGCRASKPQTHTTVPQAPVATAPAPRIAARAP